jgi:chromosome segregation ATPase
LNENLRKVEVLEKTNESLKIRLDNLEEKVKLLENENHRLKSDNSKLSQGLFDNSKILEEFDKDKENLKHRLAIVDNERRKTREDNMIQTGECDKLKTKVKSLTKENMELTEKLNETYKSLHLICLKYKKLKDKHNADSDSE